MRSVSAETRYLYRCNPSPEQVRTYPVMFLSIGPDDMIVYQEGDDIFNGRLISSGHRLTRDLAYTPKFIRGPFRFGIDAETDFLSRQVGHKVEVYVSGPLLTGFNLGLFTLKTIKDSSFENVRFACHLE